MHFLLSLPLSFLEVLVENTNDIEKAARWAWFLGGDCACGVT